MDNILKYKSRRSSRDCAASPSKRAGDSVSFHKRQLRRGLRRQLKAVGESGPVVGRGEYWY
jgi:hypothetical protein